jgi:hypothetical protein
VTPGPCQRGGLLLPLPGHFFHFPAKLLDRALQPRDFVTEPLHVGHDRGSLATGSGRTREAGNASTTTGSGRFGTRSGPNARIAGSEPGSARTTGSESGTAARAALGLSSHRPGYLFTHTLGLAGKLFGGFSESCLAQMIDGGFQMLQALLRIGLAFLPWSTSITESALRAIPSIPVAAGAGHFLPLAGQFRNLFFHLGGLLLVTLGAHFLELSRQMFLALCQFTHGARLIT